MDELIDRLAAKAGTWKAATDGTVRATLRFLRNEGAGGRASDPAPAAFQARERKPFCFGRNKIKTDEMNSIIAETPGLSQFA